MQRSTCKELIVYRAWATCAMANLKAEFHEQSDEEMNICLLESHLKMSKSHANVVSFDKNVSYLSTLMNLYERTKQLLN